MKLGKCVAIIGASGVGKTWAVHHALEHYTELTSYILKSKSDTLSFIEKVKGTDIHVVLDEYEYVHQLIGCREIKTSPTNGMFIIISQIPVKFDFKIESYIFEPMSFDQIKTLAPHASDDSIYSCKGDLRTVFKPFGSPSDEFQSPHQIVHALIHPSSSVDPLTYIGVSLPEHGNIACMMHANYVHSKMSIDDMATCCESISLAGIVDDLLYKGDWNLLPYYNFLGSIVPAHMMKHSVKTIHPGTMWTKYQNMCMREKRIKYVCSKSTPFLPECLFLLRTYAESGNIDILHEYMLEPQDIDLLNHLSPLNKIKPKLVAHLKKGLQQARCLESS